MQSYAHLIFQDLEGALYDIKFTPDDEGVHIVSLKYKG